MRNAWSPDISQDAAVGQTGQLVVTRGMPRLGQRSATGQRPAGD